MTATIKNPMTPKEIVSELDKFIVGQAEAKRAVAIALRNRWRRMQLPEDLRQEITPKNILMIGPTGVGKTEIARRLSNLAGAPFIKVEATKFTEVGYVGRDVDSIIRDLMEVGYKMTREEAVTGVKTLATESAQERILDALIPPAPKTTVASEEDTTDDNADQDEDKPSLQVTRQLFRRKLLDGELDEKEIEIKLSDTSPNLQIMGPPGMEEMVGQLQDMMGNMSSKKTKMRRIKVKDALKQLEEEEAAKLINEDDIREKAKDNVEQNAIVFLDEIDKIVRRQEHGGDVSREGVQRDLLPLVEGSTIQTKYGMINTDHILFIASGAFHLSKPSDLVPELQGRFPIRVELNALKAKEFERILTEPKASLTEQYTALLGTEGLEVAFTDGGIRRLAEIAQQVNETAENIGARRLHTLMERLLENISFNASDQTGTKYKITPEFVDEQLVSLAENEDLSRSIL